MQRLLRLHRFCSLCVMRCMHRLYKSGGHLILVRFSHNAQRQIQDQFKDKLRVSFSFTLQTLYEHFHLADLQASSAGARREGCTWFETGVMCSLQLAVGTNVKRQGVLYKIADSWPWFDQLARILRFFQHPRWTVWLTYIVTVTTVPDIIPDLL